MSCNLRNKAQVNPIKQPTWTYETELLNIRNHGLDSYDILKNPDYSELIQNLNDSAIARKNSNNTHLREDNESYDHLLQNSLKLVAS